MKKATRILALFLLAAGITACCLSGGMPANTEEKNGALRLVALNIGKADGLLLLWEDRAYLIDAGYPQNAPAVLTMLAQYGVTRLDGVFLTHCHQDHYGGLQALAASSVEIGAWYAAKIYYDTAEKQHPAAMAAAARAMGVTWLQAGDEVAVGENAAFRVLGPTTVNEANENNNSLVLRFACPAGSILFAGDMKDDEEYDLLRAGAFEKTDVLKVGHHGDNKASTLNMLRAVQPRLSLISTSTREEYDTPARSALSRLAAVGSQVIVTQDAHDAYEITLTDGTPAVKDVIWRDVPLRAENVSLSLDAKDDRLTIRNGGTEPLSLAGCTVYSTQGNESLALKDFTVSPGGQCVIGTQSTKSAYDIKWSVKRAWHKKKRDVAILYDAYGRPLACTDNGYSE